jgi:hypothetical protein
MHATKSSLQWGLINICPAGLKPNLPDLYLLSSWDYRHEPLVPSQEYILYNPKEVIFKGK